MAIYQADPGLRLYSEVGKRQPLHAGVQPHAARPRARSGADPGARPAPARFTPATRTDASWIAADLQRIRTRGYLLTTDEVVAGAATVAAPVRDASGQVVAVLSVGAPTMRMRPPRPRALLPMVLDAADEAVARAGRRHTTDRRTTRKANGASLSADHQGTALAPATAAPRPHSIFR